MFRLDLDNTCNLAAYATLQIFDCALEFFLHQGQINSGF